LKNYVKYIVAFVVIIGALGYFVVSGLGGSTIYYKEVAELVNDPLSAEQDGLRVSGNVTDNNFTMNKFDKYAMFEITDSTGTVLVVEYHGTIPDAFEQGASVILEGTYNGESKLFTANKLLAKCPSKYEGMGEEHPDDVDKQPA
jgi:cytochrome c-type biogenesis protein CcmE